MIVVADTSVFLNLGCIRHDELLPSLYGEVFAPPEVQHEFVNAVQHYNRFRGLVFPMWVRVRAPAQPLAQLAPWAQLDPGESAAISLAAELHADLLLVDEEEGRQTARRLGLRTGGILAVLLDGKTAGRVSTIAPLLDSLERNARFHLTPAVRAVYFGSLGKEPNPPQLTDGGAKPSR